MDEPHDLAGMADLCEAHYRQLVTALARLFPATDPALLADAAEDALIAYFKRPHRHDPARSPLSSYLLMSARGDLLNRQRGEARHTRRRSDVELDSLGGKGEGKALDALERREESASLQSRFDAVRQHAGPEEQAVMDLMLAGERCTEAFATALGVGHLPWAEKERKVKRAKDRVKKRLYRGGIEHGAA